jgi:hypothetical protein
MGNVSFSDRFELLDLLRDGEVQTFRARERATGRAYEVHFASSLELLSGADAVVDRGSHEGKLYVVTAEQAPLDAAGAWRIKPAAPPAPSAPAEPAAAPGDFTRMFQLRQAPEPVAAPVLKPAPAPAASQPGEFTRAFQRPIAAPSVAPASAPSPGQPGEFTRMFQQPVPATAPESSVPEPPAPTSQSKGRRLIVIAIAILSAIAVFILVKRLY